MGVYEGLTQIKPGMHWQQHQDRNQVLFTAYDPSRDLSPNLPTTTCEPAAANLSSSRGPSRSGSNSGCSTPNTRIGMCCSFKEEYEPNEYPAKVAPPQRPSSAVGGCQDCGPPGAYKGGDSFGHNHRPVICKTESDSPVDYNSCRAASDLYPSYKRGGDYSSRASIDPKSENAVGSPEDNILKICAGCGRQIADRFYLYTEDTPWHVSCLQCSQCARTLDQEVTCFARDGNIYCKKDYERLFSMNRCSRCKAAISSDEFVMRARECVFHVPCFFCVVCMIELKKGDHFGMRDGELFCRRHYESLPPHPADLNSPVPPPEDYSTVAGRFAPLTIGGPPSLPPATPHQSLRSPDFQSPDHRLIAPPSGHPPPLPHSNADGDVGCVEKAPNTFFNGVSAPRPKGRPRKRKPKDLDSIASSLDLSSDSYSMDLYNGSGHSLGGSNGSHQRTKRMRTSFKHHQLRTMKTYFTVNHNPDAKDLKQLSQKTGLAKRVLQVWFQNARAKWRRMMNKQQENNGSSIKNIDDKSCSDSSSSALESVYHHSSTGLASHSPQHYLSPTSLDCSSS